MAPRTFKSRSATPVDAHVGAKIRDRRLKLDMSQTALAEACGITFQQVQKYEKGGNRVSASRLWQLCAVLGVEIEYFFDGLAQHKLTKEQRAAAEEGSRLPVDNEAEIDKETVRLARSIAEIRDPAMRKKLKLMITALSVPS
jgi:transcriptional regulator with XRE-family HTH domain